MECIIDFCRRHFQYVLMLLCVLHVCGVSRFLALFRASGVVFSFPRGRAE